MTYSGLRDPRTANELDSGVEVAEENKQPGEVAAVGEHIVRYADTGRVTEEATR